MESCYFLVCHRNEWKHRHAVFHHLHCIYNYMQEDVILEKSRLYFPPLKVLYSLFWSFCFFDNMKLNIVYIFFLVFSNVYDSLLLLWLVKSFHWITPFFIKICYIQNMNELVSITNYLQFLFSSYIRYVFPDIFLLICLRSYTQFILNVLGKF